MQMKVIDVAFSEVTESPSVVAMTLHQIYFKTI